MSTQPETRTLQRAAKEWLDDKQDYLSRRLEFSISEVLLSRKEYKGKLESGSYPHIPWYNLDFVTNILMADRILKRMKQKYLHLRYLHRQRFLDIGCGIGTKVKIVQSMRDFSAYGLEITPKYVKFARRLVGASCIIQGDAKTFKEYSTFDILYFYRPQCDEELQLQLEKVIYEGARPEALLIIISKSSWDDDIKRDYDVHWLHGSLFIKTKDTRMVKELQNFCEEVTQNAYI